MPASYLNYWTSTSDQYPANGYPGSTNVVGDSQYLDANVVPADYMKLRYVALGYDFSRKLCKKMHLESLRLRMQFNNLLTWTRNSLGIDPEANNPVSGYSSVRTPRSYTMSLNITL